MGGFGRSAKMVSITPTRLHWIGDDGEDDPGDYCAHSPVDMRIDGKQVVSPEDGDWTVSASAIILLRSLFRNHLTDMKEEEHVFPCCGHGIWPKEGGGVIISGCPNGIDFCILHHQGTVELQIDTEAYDVSYEVWREAVVGFSEEVRRFYVDAVPKDLSPDAEPEGYIAMMSEWEQLKNQAEQDRMKR